MSLHENHMIYGQNLRVIKCYVGQARKVDFPIWRTYITDRDSVYVPLSSTYDMRTKCTIKHNVRIFL